MVTAKIIDIYLPIGTAIESLRETNRKIGATIESLQKLNRQVISELIGYTMSFLLARLRDDIEIAHGWEEEEYNLMIHYIVYLSGGFDQVFEIKKGEGNRFSDILDAYYYSDYNEEYERFWGMHKILSAAS